jgi:hypothetical protein
MSHDETAGGTLATTWELELHDVTHARFARLVVERGFNHLRSASWPTETKSLDAVLDRTLATQRSSWQRMALVDLTDLVGGECVVHLTLSHGQLSFNLAAHAFDAFAAAKTALADWFPVAQPEEKQQIGITFWSCGRGSGRRTARQIDVPSWDEIAENYPDTVRPRLGGLMGETFEPGVGGRLILWHGEPGTGKTYALRALGWEWRKWCDLHYITDPETFFGSSPAYMLDVLLDDEDDEDDASRWRLLVLEDTGELLAADAKERTGQGLSRLLNVVDGLIGQGLKILVLVTTNEPLRRLHAAVSRPGRCAVQTEFVRFTAEEAEAWLEREGRDTLGRAGTLASLYAGDTTPPERAPVGFTR